ncbi:MAG: hypothetical protein AB4352_27735 [Hormoscilla sp.]
MENQLLQHPLLVGGAHPTNATVAAPERSLRISATANPASGECAIL